MDWGIFISVAIFAVPIAALVIGVLTYRRMAPKRQIEWWLESTQLVESAGQKEITDLEIRVQGIEVPDPYMNSISLYSNSRADISSTDFDSGEPLVIEITEGGAVQLRDGGLTSGIKIEGGSGEGFEWAKFEIAPQLIRKRAKVTLTFVSSGPPRVKVHSPLVDVDIRRVPVTDQFVVPASVHPPRWFTTLFVLGAVVVVALIVWATVFVTYTWWR